MKTLLLIVLLNLSLARPGGCAAMRKGEKMSTDAALWPQFRHDAGLTAATPLKGGLSKAPKVLWTADLGGVPQADEQVRIEDFNGDGHKELLRVLDDRIICQNLRGKTLWEVTGLVSPSVSDVRDWSGDGRMHCLGRAK